MPDSMDEQHVETLHSVRRIKDRYVALDIGN